MSKLTNNNLIISLDHYSIYRIKNKNYHICIPKENPDNYQLYLCFADKDLNFLTQEEVIKKIKSINNIVQTQNPNAVLAILEIPLPELKEAAHENDDPKYNQILIEHIQPITTDIYNMLITNSKNSQQMESTINIIIRNNNEQKIADWLSMKLGDHFIKEINIEQLKKKKNESIEESKSDVLKEEKIKISPTSSISPINHQYDDISQNKDNKLIRKLTNTNNNSGFSNINFIVITIISSLIIGITFSILLIK